MMVASFNPSWPSPTLNQYVFRSAGKGYGAARFFADAGACRQPCATS